MIEKMDSYLRNLGENFEKRFASGRNILSYKEYLEEVAKNPHLHLRDAAAYVRDMFLYFGKRKVKYPWGEIDRFILFDAPFGEKKEKLVGQEEAQNTFYRIIESFVREGRANKLILLHGPNGSAKSTFVNCIARALEHYSGLEEGILYKFNWVFPSEKILSKKLGFIRTEDEGEREVKPHEYAHFKEENIDAKIPCELKDHPLLLLPPEERIKFIDRILNEKKLEIPIARLLLRGEICPKCRLIYEALLASYRGNISKLLNHIQVERSFISRIYRRGFASIAPQMSVDAGERQITVDRSLSALPKVLQNISLFEPFGDLVDGSGGVIEFSDLLKRPLEAFKYLLETIETGEVKAGNSILTINSLLLATSNEVHLNAFKQHPDSTAFIGRIAMVRFPYILNEKTERQIYKNQIVDGIEKHISPHAIEIASSWAILTRLFKPKADRYPEEVKRIVESLSCTEKFELYSSGQVPQRLSSEEVKILSGSIKEIYRETENQPLYEGITGASPREIKLIIHLASQNPSYGCLTPEAVLEEIDNFTRRKKDYGFLNAEKKEGGYSDFVQFIKYLRRTLIEKIHKEAIASSSIFIEQNIEEMWSKYITHASCWLKGERVFNPITKKSQPPDEPFMNEIEKYLDVKDSREFREEVLNKIAVAAIEKTGAKPDYSIIFKNIMEKIKESLIKEKLPILKRTVNEALKLLSGEEIKDEKDKKEAQSFIAKMKSDFGYCQKCLPPTLNLLLKELSKE